MKMPQVKHFMQWIGTDKHEAQFQNSINYFLKIKNITVLEIKYSAQVSLSGMTLLTALIIYELEKNA